MVQQQLDIQATKINQDARQLCIADARERLLMRVNLPDPVTGEVLELFLYLCVKR